MNIRAHFCIPDLQNSCQISWAQWGRNWSQRITPAPPDLVNRWRRNNQIILGR